MMRAGSKDMRVTDYAVLPMASISGLFAEERKQLSG